MVGTKTTQFPDAMQYCRSTENTTGYVINEGKCKHADLWDVKQGRVRLEVLGACIGSVEMRKAFLVEHLASLSKVISRLKQLPRHHALYILRKSTSNKLRFLLRSMDLHGVDDQIASIDAMLYDTVDFLREVRQGDSQAHEQAIKGLPGRMGGIGIYSYCEIQPFARRASLSSSRNVLVERGLSSKQKMVELAEQKQREGVGEADNPYRQVGPTPDVEDEQLQFVKQKQLTHDWMELNLKRLYDMLTSEQQLVFIDNSSNIKVLDAIPLGSYRLLTDKQIAATLNIFCLRKKHSGNICQCGQQNGISHYEVCPACDDIAKMRCYKHNAIRDQIIASINNKNNSTSKQVKASSEPWVYDDRSNNNNQSRADINISAQEGQAENHEFYGKFDIMAKAVLSPHTENARRQAETQAVQEGVQDVLKLKRRQLQAALQVGVDYKANKYAAAARNGIKVTPLLISSGGTMHKTMFKALKKIIPDGNQRRWLLLDIAISLVRGRAQVYSRDLGIVQQADETAVGD
jgi:hypothetical protein